ncbi:MAG: hypothetical protein ACOZAM_10840 [Pseudomonadota bacterium]
MAVVEPGKGRAILEPTGAGLRIIIPAAPAFFSTAFLGFWLIGWAVGEVMVSRQILGGLSGNDGPFPASLFLLAWLALWTLGGIWAIGAFLWNLTGKEVIELTSTTLKRRKQLPIFSRSREFAVANIARLRPATLVDEASWSRRQNVSSLSFKDGTIAFDYGRDTHHLASGLDEADAQYVIAEMCKRVKSLCPGREPASA